MSVDVSVLEENDRETWNSYVERSGEGTFFHRYDVLAVVERHAGGTVHLLVGHVGQEPVGVFPVFERRTGGFTTVFSPPPRLGLLFLGPATVEDPQLKQRKRERRRKRFVERSLDWIDEYVSPRYCRFCTAVGYEDPRPFSWNGFETTPMYTYRLDLDRSREELKRSFSRSLRRYLDPDDDDRYTIEVGDRDDVRFVHEQVRARYEAQGETYSVPLEFLLDMYETLPDGAVRPYVATVDGDRAGGIVALQGESTVYFSEGGGKPDVDFPVNDLLHWEIIRDARTAGVDTYDLYGANTARLCSYKAKFNPELRPYYEAEKGSMLLETAAKLYRRFG